MRVNTQPPQWPHGAGGSWWVKVQRTSITLWLCQSKEGRWLKNMIPTEIEGSVFPNQSLTLAQDAERIWVLPSPTWVCSTCTNFFVPCFWRKLLFLLLCWLPWYKSSLTTSSWLFEEREMKDTVTNHNSIISRFLARTMCKNTGAGQDRLAMSPGQLAIAAWALGQWVAPHRATPRRWHLGHH